MAAILTAPLLCQPKHNGCLPRRADNHIKAHHCGITLPPGSRLELLRCAILFPQLCPSGREAAVQGLVAKQRAITPCELRLPQYGAASGRCSDAAAVADAGGPRRPIAPQADVVPRAVCARNARSCAWPSAPHSGSARGIGETQNGREEIGAGNPRSIVGFSKPSLDRAWSGRQPATHPAVAEAGDTDEDHKFRADQSGENEGGVWRDFNGLKGRSLASWPQCHCNEAEQSKDDTATYRQLL